MQFVDKWEAVLTKPKETFAAEKKNASFAEGAKHLAIGYGVYGLLMGITLAFLNTLYEIPGMPSLPMPFPGMAAIITTPITYIIGGIVGIAIGTGVLWIIAKLLGGQGSFTAMYYLGSLYAAPLAVLQILSIISVAGGLVSLLLLVYMLYLLTLMIKEVHGFDTTKAVLVWAIPLVLLVVLAMILISVIRPTMT